MTNVRRYANNQYPYNQYMYGQVPNAYRQIPQRAYIPSTPQNIMAQRPSAMDTKNVADMSQMEFLEYMYPKDLTVKFDDNFLKVDSSRTSNMAPGWLEPTTDDFYTRVIDQPIMVKEGRVLKMTAQSHDIDQFDVDPLFDLERTYDKNAKKYNPSTGLTENETTPTFVRKQLRAVSMNFMSWITKLYLLANIKREGFHQWYYKMFGDKAGNAWMNTGLYARTDVDALTIDNRGTALGGLDGVLKQAYDISIGLEGPGAGIAPRGYSNNVSDAIDNAILTYVDQRGASKNAKLILPSSVRARLAIEVKNEKDNEFSSAVYMKGGSEIPTVYGKPILENEELERVYNGWKDDVCFNEKTGEMKLLEKRGQSAPSGYEKGVNVVYGYYGDPKNIVWGMLKDAELESSYQHPKRSYLVSVALSGDVKINYPQDTIVIPFDLGKNDPDVKK